jgi:integrase
MDKGKRDSMKKLRGEKMRTGIYRIWMLDEKTGKKHEPEKKFEAVRWVTDKGERKRQWRCFKSMQDAKTFVESGEVVLEKPASLTFGEVAKRFVAYDKDKVQPSTWVKRQQHRKHLAFFDPFEMRSITPETVDSWLSAIKAPAYVAGQQGTRLNYNNEFGLLRLIFGYYHSRLDHTYPSPVLREHRKNLTVKTRGMKPPKDLSLEQFRAFLAALDDDVEGTEHECISVIARAQYGLYARVSEIAALSVEDVEEAKGIVTLRSSVQWHKQKGMDSFFRDGHKTSDGKAVPSPRICKQLMDWARKRGITSGRLFLFGGQPITYRALQSRYDKAHRAANTGMRGTHVLRHASLSELYALSGDIQQTKAMAGHSDLSATQRYAKVRRGDLAETQALMDKKLQGTA